jgi:hypothetical protein
MGCRNDAKIHGAMMFGLDRVVGENAEERVEEQTPANILTVSFSTSGQPMSSFWLW